MSGVDPTALFHSKRSYLQALHLLRREVSREMERVQTNRPSAADLRPLLNAVVMMYAEREPVDGVPVCGGCGRPAPVPNALIHAWCHEP